MLLLDVLGFFEKVIWYGYLGVFVGIPMLFGVLVILSWVKEKLKK